MSVFADQLFTGSHLVGPGDRISVYRVTTKEQYPVFYVSQNGTINIPGLGFIDVNNKTIELIQKSINDLQKSPSWTGTLDEYSVNLAEASPFEVSVLGEFVRPGAQPAGRLSDIVAKAGDINASGTGRIFVLYPNETRQKTYKLSMFKAGDDVLPENNPWIPRWSVVSAERSKVKAFFASKNIYVLYLILASTAIAMSINR